ncbi:uncharacterized protein LOC124612741 [Schistocerca americana]|uniref:uncharacterized protein LOC124612741 n=1 Tax=Schistocerca americana TaxID=7009 RepID=UPI001F4F5D41|nr:uncharacterized protein LOC124612741 [Schistocerca americana]
MKTMARFVTLFIATLIAISQAAPRPQSGTTDNQKANSGSASSSPGNVSNSASNADSSGATDPTAIIIPREYANNLLASAIISGLTGSSNSANNPLANNQLANNPLAALISVIPNTINAERDRFSSAVENLVKGNVDPIADSIESAATTGGRVLSNGLRVFSAWPTFFGHVIG